MERRASTEELKEFTDDSPKAVVYKPLEIRGPSRLVPAVAVALYLVGFIALIVGIVLLALPKCEVEEHAKLPLTLEQQRAKRCEYTDEASRVGLVDFLNKVKKTYFELLPNYIAYDPDLAADNAANNRRIRDLFQPYNPAADMIKKRTTTAMDLLQEINSMKINYDQLKPRERKAVYQVKHFLKHVFGLNVNYFAGNFLLSPNLFCTQPICSLGYDLQNHLGYFAPKSLSDVEVLAKMLQQHVAAVDSYIENLRYGVNAGMVNPQVACVAGKDAFGRSFLNILLEGEQGALKEKYLEDMLKEDFVSGLSQDDLNKWETDNGKTLNQTLREYAVNYFGKPINKLIRYLTDEYIRYCVPSSVSSGLASLPLKHVFKDGTQTSNLTSMVLPDGSKLDGKKSYEMILSFFTTSDITPQEVSDLGQQRLADLYKQAVNVSKEVTGFKNDETKAVSEFRLILKDRKKSYFNDEKIPDSESDENAHKLCSTEEGAKKHCPKRWQALEKWRDLSREVMSKHDPNLIDLFYYTGKKHTTPNCPVELVPDLNPSSGAQSYTGSDKTCSKNCKYFLPFFLEDLGPRYSEYSVNAHEARPGHHTQVQGTVENFEDLCGGVIGWLDAGTKYGAFVEGWALYAENPLVAEGTSIYKDNPMQKYGMLKWQIWRAVRLVVDTGLHYMGLSRKNALDMFDRKAWDNTDLARKEVTRYQSWPGQATGYMIGQQHLLSLRKKVEKKLGHRFSLSEFHFQILSQGSSPLDYLTDHVDRYIRCSLDWNSSSGCEYITGPESIPLPASGKKKGKKRIINSEEGQKHFL